MNLTSEHELCSHPSLSARTTTSPTNALERWFRCDDFDVLAREGVAKAMAALLPSGHFLVMVLSDCRTSGLAEG